VRRSLLISAAFCVGCICPEGYIDRKPVAPSVEAVTVKFEELVREAGARGELSPIEERTWIDESALLRHLFIGDPEEPVPVPE
jgi:hypothetical protein